MKAAMAKRKKHSRVEIATKLAQANDLATQGKLQSEIAHTLGVSVMTLHRWRKAPPEPQPADDRTAKLQLENSRLRRLVTDLLLEKVKVEEVTPKSKTRRVKGPKAGSVNLLDDRNLPAAKAAPWPGKRKSMKRNYQVKRNPRPKTKVRKRGRPPLDNRPMTSAERVRKHRARKRQAASRGHVGGYLTTPNR
jgi:hypothetical protein